MNPESFAQKAKLFFELYRQKQELARALRAREDVLAIVSHDMRTPLSVVHTTASMLLNPKYQLTPQQVREQHERIKRNVELMNRMIGDLLDMANLRAGKLSIDPQAHGHQRRAARSGRHSRGGGTRERAHADATRPVAT